MPSSFKVNTVEKPNSVSTCTFLAWLPWDYPKFLRCSLEVWKLPCFSQNNHDNAQLLGGRGGCGKPKKTPNNNNNNKPTKKQHNKKPCKKNPQTFSLQKSVTFQTQHLTFPSSSHQMLGWSNTFHRTLLVWFLYKNTQWGAPWSWQSSSLRIMSCYLCVVFDYHFVKANSWSAEGRGRKGWVGMGCCGIMLAGQFTFERKFMGLSTKTSLKKKKGSNSPHSWAFLVILPFNQCINQIIAVPKVELHL